MALTFPSFPTVNQTFTYNSRTWKWNGVAWDAVITVEPVTLGGGLNQISVEGDGSVADVETLTIRNLSDVLNYDVTEPSGNDALLTVSITGDSGTNISRTLTSNHFSPVQSPDRSGTGRKVLVLNNDGSVGFEYIKFQDVFKNSDFSFAISNFRLNNSSTRETLIGDSSRKFRLNDFAGTDAFTLEYPNSGSGLNPVSATISSSSFSEGQTSFDLDAPYTFLDTDPDEFQVNYSSESGGEATFLVQAQSESGETDTATCRLKFLNYLYWGVAGVIGIDGTNLNTSGFTEVLIEPSDFSGSNGFEIEFNIPGENDYLWLAYPAKFGQLSNVKNALAGQDVSDEFPNRSPESHTNELDFVEDYRIYRISRPGSGQLTYQFFI